MGGRKCRTGLLGWSPPRTGGGGVGAVRAGPALVACAGRVPGRLGWTLGSAQTRPSLRRSGWRVGCGGAVGDLLATTSVGDLLVGGGATTPRLRRLPRADGVRVPSQGDHPPSGSGWGRRLRRLETAAVTWAGLSGRPPAVSGGAGFVRVPATCGAGYLRVLWSPRSP